MFTKIIELFPAEYIYWKGEIEMIYKNYKAENCIFPFPGLKKCYSLTLKGKWQENFLSSHFKETSKQYIEVYYRIFISALFREIFSFEILSCPPSWIFVDMHDASQQGSRDFFFLTTQ